MLYRPLKWVYTRAKAYIRWYESNYWTARDFENIEARVKEIHDLFWE